MLVALRAAAIGATMDNGSTVWMMFSQTKASFRFEGLGWLNQMLDLENVRLRVPPLSKKTPWVPEKTVVEA